MKSEYTKKELIDGQVVTHVKRTKSKQLGEILVKGGWEKKDPYGKEAPKEEKLETSKKKKGD